MNDSQGTSVQEHDDIIPSFEDAKSPTEQREALAVHEGCALTVSSQSVFGIVVGGSMLSAFGRAVDESQVKEGLKRFIESE